MMDQEQSDLVRYMRSEIEEKRDKPYMMANETLADELLSHLKEKYPDIRIIKFGGFQWLLVNQNARMKLVTMLENQMKKRRVELQELRNVVSSLQSI